MDNYFSHDADARNDSKILRLRMRHGMEGYGVYFAILERLRMEGDYQSQADYDMIAFDLRCDAELVRSVVEDFGLFQLADDGQTFYSDSFNRRMTLKDDITKKRSESGRRGASNRWQAKDKNEAAETAETAGKDEKDDETEATENAGKSPKNGKKMAKLPKTDGKAMAKPCKNDGKAMATPMANDGNKSKVKERKENISSPPRSAGAHARDGDSSPAPPDAERQWADDLLADETFRETAAMNLRQPPETIGELLREFASEQQAKQTRHSDPSDMRRHAYDWLRIRTDYLNKQKQRQNADTSRDYQTAAAYESRQREAAAAIAALDSRTY